MNLSRSLLNYAVSKIKDQDIMHRAFLKPFQIALKTQNTQSAKGHKSSSTSLPSGLKMVVKERISNNRYDLADIESIEVTDRWKQIKSNSQDNSLSLMKCKEQGIQLAICVCMYSQDAKMLKSTLAGIGENISNIVLKEKISPDKIAVFVIIDGVQKIDKTVVNYFQELQRRNNINLGQNIAPTLTPDEIMKRATKSIDEINQQEMNNVNNFLFDPAELTDRNQRRFCSVYNQFQEIKKLQETIDRLKKSNVKLDQLPFKLRQFFISQLRNQYKSDYSLDDKVDVNLSDDKLISEYENDPNKLKPILVKVLNEGDRHCTEFFKSRDDLAYLAFFRNKIRHEIQSQNLTENPYQQQEDDMLNQQSNLTTTMNLFLCVKYKNSGKLSSHNWFINGFCKELQPKYSVLLDVGLRPEAQALLKMYTYMKRYPKVGGVCGYMSLKIEKVQQKEQVSDEEVDWATRISMFFANIQKTQQVQYHFAHLVDKPFESTFNFIHVLPGAFSAYNMKAILDYKNDEDDQLLKSYFKSLSDKLKQRQIKISQLSVSNILVRTLLPDVLNRACIEIDEQSDEQMLYNQNVYLAEDRILCMGIFKKGFKLAYLPDAFAQVDPVKTLHGLLGQRKRWINGSFFAFQKVKKELVEYQKQNGCQVWLHLQVVYLTFMNGLLFFAPSFFLFTIHIAMEAFREDVLVKVLKQTIYDPNDNQFLNFFVYTVDFIYVLLMLSVVFYSLLFRNTDEKQAKQIKQMKQKFKKQFKSFIYGVSTVLGIFSIVVFIVLVVDVFRGLIDQNAFLIQNEAFIENIPGGINLINALRWTLIGSMALYIIPIFTYIFLYGKVNILGEIIIGAFSLLFYGPTYLNILYAYSICRIDDFSWGTKGLDADGNSNNQKLANSWRAFKFLHVGKYVGWNIVVSVIMLSLGSSYTPRIFISIIIIAIMAFSQSIKIFLGVFYMIAYKIKTLKCCQKERQQYKLKVSRINEIIDLHKDQILKEVIDNLKEIEEQLSKDGKLKIPGGSFIQMSRSKKVVQKCFQKKKEDFNRRSAIFRKNQKKYQPQMDTIPEQRQEFSQETSKKEKWITKRETILQFDESQEQLSPQKLLPKK